MFYKAHNSKTLLSPKAKGYLVLAECWAVNSAQKTIGWMNVEKALFSMCPTPLIVYPNSEIHFVLFNEYNLPFIF